MPLKSQTSKMIRIVLLDDHTVVRHGLSARLLEEVDFRIVGAYATSKELMADLEKLQVDVFVIDYALGEEDIDGLHLVRALLKRLPGCNVLVSSAYYNAATVALALRAGAKGYVGKGQALDELVNAIRTVAEGKIYVSAGMTAELMAMTPLSSSQDTIVTGGDFFQNGYDLSPREREVLRCCLDGMTVTQIANKFARSVKTISGQKQSAFRKLGIRNDGELFKIRQHLKDL